MTNPNCQTLEPRRFFAAGDPLDSFGQHGVAAVPGDIEGCEVSDVTATPDGKLLASLHETFAEPGDLVRFNADGSLDATFGNGGVVDTFFGTTRQVAVRSDGRFYAVGSGQDNALDGSEYGIQGSGKWFLARFLPDGRLDRSFGMRGRVRLRIDSSVNENYDPTSHDNRSIHLDSDGRLTLVSYVASPDLNDYSDPDYVVYRYDATGRLDPTFNGGQPLKLHSAVDNLDWPALTVSSNGEMLIAANREFRHRVRTVALRLRPSGEVDTKHAPDGFYTVDNVELEQPRAAFAPDGHIFVSGASDNIEDIGTDLWLSNDIYKLTAKGHHDTSFGGGHVRFAIESTDIVEVPLVPLPDGGIVFGEDAFPIGMIVQRLRADGTTDPAFGKTMTDGIYPVVMNNVLYTQSYARVLAQSLDGNGVSPITMSNKKLKFNGTDAADDITIGNDTDRLFGEEGEFRVTRNAWSRIYPEAAISSVVLNAGAGDDTVEIAIRDLPISVTVNAGGGDDAITATGAHITVHGGAGDDTVKGDSSDSDPQ